MIPTIQLGQFGRTVGAAPGGRLGNHQANLLFAYGLERMVDSYSGPVMKVRSPTNGTLDIGLVGNALDTAALLAHCASGDGWVDTWYDQSGNGVHLLQATTTKQYKVVSSGSYLGYLQGTRSALSRMKSTASVAATTTGLSLAGKMQAALVGSGQAGEFLTACNSADTSGISTYGSYNGTNSFHATQMHQLSPVAHLLQEYSGIYPTTNQVVGLTGQKGITSEFATKFYVDGTLRTRTNVPNNGSASFTSAAFDGPYLARIGNDTSFGSDSRYFRWAAWSVVKSGTDMSELNTLLTTS